MNQIASTISQLSEPDSDARYDDDLVLWFEQQAALLRTQQFSKLDVEHLIDELEAMAGRDRRELKSRLCLLLVHLLKCGYQPTMKSSSWLGTIRTQRQEIRGLLEQSPSLSHHLVPYTDKQFKAAVDLASDETGLPPDAFPQTCPYTLGQILDDKFIP